MEIVGLILVLGLIAFVIYALSQANNKKETEKKAAAETPVNNITVVESKTEFCSTCGKEVYKEAVICPSCGVARKPLIQKQPPVNPKSRGVAAVLALLLGGIGVHRFYLDQTNKGLMYLLFCWTLIPAFIAFIDFIAFLLVSKKDFDKEYNNGFAS